MIIRNLLQKISLYNNCPDLFYGCPRAPEELEPVLVNNKLVPGIRPNTPQTYDFETGLFVPHSSEPVVCAGTDMTVVAFHGLVRADAINVPPYARRNGWEPDAHGIVRRVCTTLELNDYIQGTRDFPKSICIPLTQYYSTFSSLRLR